MLKNHEDPSYVPPTYLMDEVRPGEKYELVFTILKGGAFARYRCGDMYRCVGLENREDETQIPRFEYVDRVPWIIDKMCIRDRCYASDKEGWEKDPEDIS